MADLDLRLGDNMDVMKTIPDNSIDTIITDPPYGLSFMGKKWDYDVPSVETWQECLRVLKPGGTALIFAGSRTQHRMAVNVEDAGFILNDCIMWLYGCYSSDTECLTNNGFKLYEDISETDRVLQWNSETNELTWIKPLEKFEYDYNGKMIRFRNRHTDQVLTPNHRVYAKITKHARNEKSNTYDVMRADKLKRNWHKDFPLAGNLYGGTKTEKAYIIGWWMTDAWLHGDGKACMFSQCKPKTLIKLRNALKENDCKFSEYIKKAKKKTHRDEHTFYVTGNLADYLINNFPNRELTWDVLQWDYDSRLRLLSGLMDGDGSMPENKHSQTFWSLKKRRLDIVQAICTSLNIRSYTNYIKGCLYLNRKRNSTQLQHRHYTEPKEYNGKVWCLRTETGAFVVRRNGKVFISGNSGFPKNHNISKQLKKQGNIEQSEVFDGYGSHSIKPAYEPILVAMKPNDQSYAKNALKWGVAGLNIDGARVTYESGGDLASNPSLRKSVKGGNGGHIFPPETESREMTPHAKGRFPANIILSHSPNCKVIGQTTVDGRTINRFDSGMKPFGDAVGESFQSEQMPDDVVDVYECVEDCPCRMLDEQSNGASRFFYCAKASKREKNLGLDEFDAKPPAAADFRPNHTEKALKGEDGNPYGRWSPTKNIHPTVKPLALMEYLCTLTDTPTKGVVLDPFMGSGTTGMACVKTGRNFIGIELDPDYFAIAEKRISAAGLQMSMGEMFR